MADVDEGELSESSAGARGDSGALARRRGVSAPSTALTQQAALLTFRKLPRGAELAAGAREEREGPRRPRRDGDADSISLANAGPGSYVLSLATEGLELSVRVDRQECASTPSASRPVAGKRYYMVGVDLEAARASSSAPAPSGSKRPAASSSAARHRRRPPRPARRSGSCRCAGSPVPTRAPTSTAAFSSSPPPRARR